MSGLRGRPFSTAEPNDGDTWQWVADAAEWQPRAPGALGGDDGLVITSDMAINAGFVNSFDTVLWVAGAQRVNPTVQTEGLYVQHRVTGDLGARTHDGGASELRVNAATNASFLNAFEASAVVTGGANTIPDLRAITANLNSSGSPSGTITSASVIRSQAVSALAGSLANNYTIYAPLGISRIGTVQFESGSVKIIDNFLTFRNSADSGTNFQIENTGVPRWNATANQQTTVGAAGAASALPATPTKYLKVKDSAGTVLVIPAYAAA